MLLLLLLLLSLIENIFPSKPTMKIAVIVILALLSCVQAAPVSHPYLKTLFTWSGGPRSSGVGFFCLHALADTKQKKPTPLDRGPPLHVNMV